MKAILEELIADWNKKAEELKGIGYMGSVNDWGQARLKGKISTYQACSENLKNALKRIEESQ